VKSFFAPLGVGFSKGAEIALDCAGLVAEDDIVRC